MLEQTQKDSLTKFYLRESLKPYLQNLIIEAKLKKKRFSLVLIDLDRFKKFNDKFGHIFGDEILKYATSTLRLTFSDIQCSFFRYGGDEFIAVFPNKEPKEVLYLMHRCHYNMLHRPFLFLNKFYKITISCGICAFPIDGDSEDELIKKADEAMYFSKRYGRNLSTLANRIKYLKIRRIFFVITSISIIAFSLFILYRLGFMKDIKPTVTKIKNIKIITKPKDLDTVILKNGSVFEGRILTETEDKMILNLYFEKEEGIITFNKSEIAQIKYGSKESPQKDK